MNRSGRLHIESLGGVFENEEGWVVAQFATQHKPLLIPAGQCPCHCVWACSPYVELADHTDCSFSKLSPVKQPAPLSGIPECEIFCQRKTGDKRILQPILRYKPDSQ